MGITYKGLILAALSNLKVEAGDDALFEKLAIRCIQIIYSDITVLPSSGISAGGDCGRDGIIFETLNGEKGKIAISTENNWREKLREEIEKTKKTFKRIIFCSNQRIDNKDEDRFIEKYCDYKIEIFGRSKLANIIIRDYDAQSLLEIPRIKNELTVDQLRNHSQLKKEHEVIENFIPRYLLCDSENEPINILSLFRDYDLNTVTIIDSPAGYGKTGALKYAYYHLLFDDECFIPPFFFSLDHYREGDLRTKIEEIEKLLYEEKTVNYYLLIDGIDNLTNKTFCDLLHELDILLNTVQSCYRKVIMTGRTGEYQTKIINEYFGDDVSYYLLAGLTKDDINAILNKQTDLPEECRVIIQHDLEQENTCKSIFYVTRLISIYKENQESHLPLIKLLSIVSEDELELLFKGKQYDLRGTQQLSLDMTRGRMTICEDSERLKRVSFPGDSFSFSHKTIQEYLSARELAEMDYQSIINIVSSFGLIIPYLKNTVGLLLNTLIIEGKKNTFEKLIRFLEKNPKNYYVLFKIESDFVDRELVGRIFRDYLEAFNGYDWTIRSNEELFNFICYDIDSNCSYLLSQIKNAKDETRKDNLLHLCYEFALSHCIQLPSHFSKEFLELFFEYLDCDDYKAVRNMIWTVSNLYDSVIDNQIIDCLISKVFSLWEYDVFVPFIRIISKNNYDVSPDQMLEIFKTYWEIEKHNKIGAAHFVSPLITSVTEYEEPFLLRSTYGFVEFLNKHLVTSQQSFYKIVNFLHEELHEFVDIGLPLKKDISSVIANCFVIYGSIRDDCYKKVMDIVCSIHYVKGFAGAFKDLLPELAFSMIKYKFEERQGVFLYGSGNRVFEEFYKDVLFKEEYVFSEFLSFFKSYKIQVIIAIIGYYCCNSSEQSWYKRLFPKELYESYSEYKKKQELYVSREIQYKKQLSESFAKAFSMDFFLNDSIREVFFRFENGVIPEEALFHIGFDDFSIRSSDNPFACFVVEKYCILHHLNEYNQFVKAISKEYAFNILWLLVEYFKANSLSPSIINESGNAFIETSVSDFLLKYPFLDYGTKENNAQRLVIELFQKHFNQQFFSRLLSSGNSSLVFHIAMSTAELNYTTVNEFEYLTSIVDNEVICSCVLDRIESINDSFEINKACRVFTSLCNNEDLKKRIIAKTNPVVVRFIQDNLSNDTYATHVIEYAKHFNITVFDFQEKEIESGFIYIKGKRQLGNTLVSDWMSIYKKKSEQEISFLCSIFERKMCNSKFDDEKRVFAEMLLFYDTDNMKVLKWLVRYLIKNENCCLSEEIFGHRGKICTNNYSAVNLLFKLYKKSFDYHSELREAVQRFVVSSIKAIADKPSISKNDFHRLIKKTEKLIRFNPIEIVFLIDSLKENYLNRMTC